MSVKSNGRQLGRMIRRITGLKLPIAMKMGKMVAQYRERELVDKFPEYVSMEVAACQCCGPEMHLKGPKGSIEGILYITASIIEREYRIQEAFLKKVPMGTPVSISRL